MFLHLSSASASSCGNLRALWGWLLQRAMEEERSCSVEGGGGWSVVQALRCEICETDFHVRLGAALVIDGQTNE